MVCYVYVKFNGFDPSGKTSKFYLNEEVWDGLFIEDGTLFGVGDEGGQERAAFDTLDEAEKWLRKSIEAFEDDSDFLGGGLEYDI